MHYCAISPASSGFIRIHLSFAGHYQVLDQIERLPERLSLLYLGLTR